jgi:site-specific DNA-methyltransferase (adenine-specific)
VVRGDCVELMGGLEAGSVDAVVCDPPYEIAFMGRSWDQRGVAFDPATWAEALRVLKPGGYLLAFGGTRTYHRLACAVEDAGFEIRDTICWLYGSGFPKSKNLDGDREGWGTALKPAHEPIVVARKPLIGTVAANVLAHGTGALNVDGCRIGFSEAEPYDIAKVCRPNTAGENHAGAVMNRPDAPTVSVNAAGRWPANVALDEDAAAMLDEQSGTLAPGNHPAMRSAGVGGYHGWPTGTNGERVPTDAGGASRFYYVAKADSAERNAGLEGFEVRAIGIMDDRPSGDSDQRRGRRDGNPRVMRNPHPTVKPVALMRWLVRLVTPPGGLVLDPFTGSGTTGIAALREGFSFVGFEQDPEYVEIARARIVGDAPLINGASEAA